MSAENALQQWRQDPFRLLQEMERRAREHLASRDAGAGESNEWVGVACRCADRKLLLPRDDIREILVMPTATRVPGARSWVAGLANVRGQLLPIVDLSAFAGGEATAPSRATRVVWVNHRSIPAGLLLDEVYGFRRFAVTDESTPLEADNDKFLQTFVSGEFTAGSENWPVLSLRAIVECDRFLQAAE